MCDTCDEAEARAKKQHDETHDRLRVWAWWCKFCQEGK